MSSKEKCSNWKLPKLSEPEETVRDILFACLFRSHCCAVGDLGSDRSGFEFRFNHPFLCDTENSRIFLCNLQKAGLPHGSFEWSPHKGNNSQVTPNMLKTVWTSTEISWRCTEEEVRTGYTVYFLKIPSLSSLFPYLAHHRWQLTKIPTSHLLKFC